MMSRTIATFIRVAAALLVTMSAAWPAGAQTTRLAADSVLEARTRAMAAQLRCPVCQGLSLQDSPSELAQQMRDVVKQQLASGKTDDEVKQFFVGRYGEWILMSPTAHGFNWLVYVLPVFALALGLGLLALAVRRWTSAAPVSDESMRTPTAV
jgi:cytochrome c-type biogenesis protein CcmH